MRKFISKVWASLVEKVRSWGKGGKPKDKSETVAPESATTNVEFDDVQLTINISPPGTSFSVSVDPADYANLVDGQSFTSLVNLDGSGGDTLYRDCTFTNSSGNGVDLRNVTDVTFYRCTFQNINGNGIRMRSSGSTARISAIDCDFISITANGITSAQRSQSESPPVDHPNTVVESCYFEDVSTASSANHMVYLQGTEFSVINNEFVGDFGGNVISVRSSGVVSGNTIHNLTGALDGNPVGVKYFSDHKTGTSKTLTIINNVINGGSVLEYGAEVKRNETGVEWGLYTGAEEDWHINTLNWYGNSFSNILNSNTALTVSSSETPYTSEVWFTQNTTAP